MSRQVMGNTAVAANITGHTQKMDDLPGVDDLYDTNDIVPSKAEPTAPIKFSRASVNDRLRELESLKNKGRGKGKAALNEEVVREKEGVKGRIKREKKEEKEREEKFKESLAASGIDPERYFRLHTTQETEEAAERRKKRKLAHAALDTHSLEVEYRTHKKRSAKVDFNRAEYEKQKAHLGDDFYNTNALNYGNEDLKPTEEQLYALREYVSETQERRKDYSRRRKWDDNATIDFINERNKNFNAKASRAYDKYTEEIRENLERGTAL
eukprot:TRINITY_DN2246_c6_g1_i1.p1 TRINITY_DN2246_c6_g1~~TRINITY_DN2246_c6_g1_i1.p1  ORF type:complete len:268 (+),score=70.90 TRINITY_DN2246_c6_g1_i1:78-881(+)